MKFDTPFNNIKVFTKTQKTMKTMKTMKFTRLILALALLFVTFNVSAQLQEEDLNVVVYPAYWNPVIETPDDFGSQTFSVSEGTIHDVICQYGFTPPSNFGYTAEDFLTPQISQDGTSFTATLSRHIFTAALSTLVTHFVFNLFAITNPVLGLFVAITIDVIINLAIDQFSSIKIQPINNLGLLAGSLSIKKERILNRNIRGGLLALNFA